MKLSATKNCDIIKALNDYALHHVIKKIFSYLNLHDLQSATISSRHWQEIIFVTGLWMQMYQKNLNSLHHWKRAAEVISSIEWAKSPSHKYQESTSHDEYFYEACIKIHQSLLNIDRNWRKNNYSLQTFCFGEGRENKFDSTHVCVTPRWVFIAERLSKNQVQVWNRKTKLLEKALDPISDEVVLERRVPGLISTQNEIIVAYPEDRMIIIWKHNTWEQVATIKEYSCNLSKEGEADIDRDKHSILQPRMVVHGESLLTCLSRSEEVQHFTLRKLSVCDAQIKYQWCLFLNGSDQILKAFDMTSYHILIHVGPDNWDPDMIRDRWTAFTIQVRSNTTFDLLRNVEYSRSSPIHCFHHGLGSLMAVGIGSSVRIWDAETGSCLNIFRNSAVRLTSVQMVSNKYIVTCDESGCIKVWDQQLILELDEEADLGELRSCLLWESSIITRLAGGSIDLDDRLLVLADEFRIAILLSNDRSQCVLHVMDFFAPK